MTNLLRFGSEQQYLLPWLSDYYDCKDVMLYNCDIQGTMTWKVLSMVAVAGIAALLHYETEEDILYVSKEVVLPVTRAKAFLFVADMSNYRRVRTLYFCFNTFCNVVAFVTQVCKS